MEQLQTREETVLRQLHLLDTLRHALRRKYLSTGDRKLAQAIRAQLKALSRLHESSGYLLKVLRAMSGGPEAANAEMARIEKTGRCLAKLRDPSAAKADFVAGGEQILETIDGASHGLY